MGRIGFALEQFVRHTPRLLVRRLDQPLQHGPEFVHPSRAGHNARHHPHPLIRHPTHFFLTQPLRGDEVDVGRFELGEAAEFGPHLHADPIQGG